MPMTAPAAVEALDRAVVDALEVAARAFPEGASWEVIGRGNYGYGEEADLDCMHEDFMRGALPLQHAEFFAALTPARVLALIAAWRDAQILDNQNKLALSNTMDLGEALDEAREAIHRKDLALALARRAMNHMGDALNADDVQPSAEDAVWLDEAFEAVAEEVDRAALEGSTHRG